MAYDSQAGLVTQLENSKHLISMATTYPLYSPIFALIKLDAYGSFVISVETAKYTPFVKIGFTIIKALLTNSSAKHTALTKSYGLYTNEKAKVLPEFDGPEGLVVRTEHAKAHVRNVYGSDSSQLKALTGKIY